MKLENINPFIRRAFFLNSTPDKKTVKNADCRLFYVLEGSGEITVNGTEHRFEKDALGLWEAGTEYCWKFSKNNKCQLAIINFDYTQEYKFKTEMLPLITKPFSKEDMIYNTDVFSDSITLNTPIFLNNMHIFKSEVKEIVAEFEEKKLYSSELSSSMLKQLIIKIVRYISSTAVTQTKIEPLLQYIRLHYNEDLTNHSLGEMANYHPHYVNVLMKTHTGTTLHSYLREIRLGEALKYVVNTDENIENIAFKVGYKNPTHFCTSFKKKFGLSPAAYRKFSKIV